MKIILDWGSTNFRAYLANDGMVIDRKHLEGGGTLTGLLKQGTDAQSRIAAYSQFMNSQIGDWLSKFPQADIYICGAAGGREGWVETVYTVVPASIKNIQDNFYKIKPHELGAAANRDIYIMTGCATRYNHRDDVMRGEEIKALGAIAHLKLPAGIFCIPGTHCKWVEIQGDKITKFKTYMTGEIYSLLHHKGALATLLQKSDMHDADSFLRGIKLATQEDSDLIEDIWQVRAQYLRGAAPADLSSFLSGILLAHEIAAMKKSFPKDQPLVLLADGHKKEIYETALQECGWSAICAVDNETAICSAISLF